MLNHLLNQFLAVGGHLHAAQKHLKNGYCGSGSKRLDEALQIIEREIKELRARLEQNSSEQDLWQDL
ncbi:MAG: hypothetical protein ACFFCW_19820 [Candidatus Hodarchaeota archaeon]